MAEPILPPLNPIPMKDRISVVFVEKGNLDVLDEALWESGDVPNRCLSSATACLYCICEAAILAAGYAPAVGFIHTGKPQSFVYDIADIFKFETVISVAFRIAAKQPSKSRKRSSHRLSRFISAASHASSHHPDH